MFFPELGNVSFFDREFKLPIPPPLVSVVMPFCNCEKYAAKTLSDMVTDGEAEDADIS